MQVRILPGGQIKINYMNHTLKDEKNACDKVRHLFSDKIKKSNIDFSKDENIKKLFRKEYMFFIENIESLANKKVMKLKTLQDLKYKIEDILCKELNVKHGKIINISNAVDGIIKKFFPQYLDI